MGPALVDRVLRFGHPFCFQIGTIPFFLQNRRVPTHQMFPVFDHSPPVMTRGLRDGASVGDWMLHEREGWAVISATDNDGIHLIYETQKSEVVMSRLALFKHWSMDSQGRKIDSYGLVSRDGR